MLFETKKILKPVHKMPIFLFVFLLINFSSNSNTYALAEQSLIQDNKITIKTNNIKLKYIKNSAKPKLIFQPNTTDDRKLSFPKKLLYSIKNYRKNSFDTFSGIPLLYEMIEGNRYFLTQLFYASGGSGSLDNLFIFDTKESRGWHLYSADTVAGSGSYYQFSADRKYLFSYDPSFVDHIVITAFDKNKENTPFIYTKITKTQIEKILKDKFKIDNQIYYIDLNWLNNQLKMVLKTNTLDENPKDLPTISLVFDLASKKFKEMNNYIDKYSSMDWKKLHIQDYEFDYKKTEILSADQKFAKVYFYRDLRSESPKREYILQIIRLQDYKIIFEDKYITNEKPEDNSENTDKYYLNWVTNDLAKLQKPDGNNYILKIKNNGDNVEVNKNNQLEYLNKENLSADQKFALISKEDSKSFIELVDMNTYQTIFSAEILTKNNSNENFSWLNKQTFLFIDKSGKVHMVKINNNSVENSVIDNLPKIISNKSFQSPIFSNAVYPNISIIADNNLYYLDIEKLTAIKITDFNKIIYNDDEIIYSAKKPVVSYPYISNDKKIIFYCNLIGYDLIQLMTLDLEK